MYIFYYVYYTTFPPAPFPPPLPSPPDHAPPPPYSCSNLLQRFHIIIARYRHIASWLQHQSSTTGPACIATSYLWVTTATAGRPLAGPPACAGDLSAVNQPYHPHPTLLCSFQPVGRSNYFMRLTAPQNSHSHTDRQTAQLNYIYRWHLSLCLPISACHKCIHPFICNHT